MFVAENNKETSTTGKVDCVSFITARNSSCGKVMFSQARVKNSGRGGGGGIRGRKDGPLQRAVRILPGCILVEN